MCITQRSLRQNHTGHTGHMTTQLHVDVFKINFFFIVSLVFFFSFRLLCARCLEPFFENLSSLFSSLVKLKNRNIFFVFEKLSKNVSFYIIS